MAEYNLKYGGYETDLILCEDKYKEISSTLVREKLKKGEDLTGLLPDSVIEYLKNK